MLIPRVAGAAAWFRAGQFRPPDGNLGNELRLNSMIEEEPTMRIRLLIVLGATYLLSFVSTANAFEPNWSNEIITFGARRQQIESMDILERPYRPFHFYGNTVRRSHYRGWPLPTARDFARGTAVMIRRR